MYSKTSGPPSRWPERDARAGAGRRGSLTPAPAPPPETEPGDGDVSAQQLLAFAPLHKRALGLAIGSVCGLAVFAMTVFHLIARPGNALNLYLLSEYFYGYTVSWQGAFVGAWWGFFTGFVGGWFLAFCRNFAVAASLFLSRTRAELEDTRDFLDHI